MFPSEYFKELYSQKSINQEIMNQAKNKEISEVKKSIYYHENISKAKQEDKRYSTSLGAIGSLCGCIVGFCVWMTYQNLILGIMTAIIIFLALYGIGRIKEISSARSAINPPQKLTDQIEKIETHYNHLFHECDIDFEKKYNDFLEEFERCSRRESQHFAQSDLTQEIVTWLIRQFTSRIVSANVSESSPQMVISFSLEVYKEKIQCTYGDIDFVKKCWETLSSEYEQAGLCFAICESIKSQIEISFSETYPDSHVNIHYSYSSKCPIAEIEFSAPNKKYQKPRAW